MVYRINRVRRQFTVGDRKNKCEHEADRRSLGLASNKHQSTRPAAHAMIDSGQITRVEPFI